MSVNSFAGNTQVLRPAPRSHWPASIALGLLSLLSLFSIFARASAQPAPAVYAAIPSATPAIARMLAPSEPVLIPHQPPVIAGYWSPGGEQAGMVELSGPILVIEQYQGWARFRTAHMAGDLWAPLSDLTPVVDPAALAAAPEIAPTALPYVPPPPAPAHSAPSPVEAAPFVALPQAESEGATCLQDNLCHRPHVTSHKPVQEAHGAAEKEQP